MYVYQKNTFSSEEVVQSYALFLKNLRQFVPKTFTYVSCPPKMTVFCAKNVKAGDVPSVLIIVRYGCIAVPCQAESPCLLPGIA